MAQRHLKELLEEDQEPFYLKDYIADKKCIIFKKQSPKTTQIQVKKHKNNSFFPKNVCFSSMQQYSPDYRKSPLFDFSKSPVSKKSPNRVLLHVPAKTASLLLEAALKIQQKSKPKSHFRQSGFGLFGSVLKRLSLRTRTQTQTQTQKLKQSDAETNAGVVVNGLSNVSSVSSGSSSFSNYNVRTSSLDLESSSSSSSSSSGRSFGDNHNHDDDDDNDDYDDDDDYDEEEFEFSNVLLADNNDDDNNHGDYGALCLSPFHFTNSSPNIFQNNQNYDEQDSSVKCQLEDDDEEDKEQNSPVSVFDPPFEDDYDNHDDDCYDDYAFVQRAKQQLMHKLHRFETLAKLDPIELEKKMLDDNDNSEEEYGVVQQVTDEMDEYDYESFTFANEEHYHDLLEDSVATSGFQDINKPGIKRLISDLIIEEQQNVENYELVISGLLKRMEEWKEVECNTIDMMVETDLRGENGDWKKPKTQISETASDIEVAIFGVLVTELVTDIAYSSADGRCGQ